MADREADGRSERVLVVAPVGRDAAVIAQMLARAGVVAEGCADLAVVARRVEAAGAGAAVLTEESLTQAALPALLDALGRQPAWSDLPLLVLASAGDDARVGHDGIAALETRTNLTLVERPVRVRTL